MFDKIITIALNPSIDVTLWPETYDCCEPNRCSREKVYPGGKSVNVTRVLKSLGIPAHLIGIAGRENIDLLRGLLDRDGIDYRLLETAGAVRENITVITPARRAFTVNRQGIPIEKQAWDQLFISVQKELVPDGENLVVFAGSLPPNISAAEYKRLILSIRRHNVKIALDTDFLSFSQIREIAPFVIKPNMKEAENILSRSGITARDAFGAASLLAEAAEHVLLSMGAQGICYHHRQEGLRVRVPAVAVSSTVGAGDTALAGFLAMIQQGKNLPDSVRYAAACSCASVTLEGTQAVTKVIASRYLTQIQTTKL